jgi:hypothetical protein
VPWRRGTGRERSSGLDIEIGSEVRGTWTEALATSGSGDVPRAKVILLRLGRDGEEGFLRNFGIRALEMGRGDRVAVHGLSAPDILDYLPVEVLVPNAGPLTWDQLRAKALTAGVKRSTAFKKWLAETFGFRDDDAVIEQAARSLDSLPDDFAALLERARKLRRPWWDERLD